jgi:hypothetical protein
VIFSIYPNLADIWFSVIISQVLNELNFSLFNPIYKIPNCYITLGNLTNIAFFQIPPSGTKSALLDLKSPPQYLVAPPFFLRAKSDNSDIIRKSASP